MSCHHLGSMTSTRTKGSSSSPLLRGWLFPNKPSLWNAQESTFLLSHTSPVF